MASTIKFREQLRRTTSETIATARRASNHVHDAIMDEGTPLMGYVPGTHASQHTHHGTAWHVLFDRKHTPGTNSETKPTRWVAQLWHIIKVSLLSSPVNILLVFVPLGIIAGKLGWSSTAIFTLNFFAIIPLAAVLSFATEEISKHLGDALGGLLNATFGNAVELIVSIVALRAGEIEIVQASMLGSILSNLLLVMGMCFFLGGIWNMRNPTTNLGTEQTFANGMAQATCSLLALSSASMILPAALYGVLDNSTDPKRKEDSILLLSRGTAIILLFLYVLFLYFQLHTHKNMFDPERDTTETTESGSTTEDGEAEDVSGLSTLAGAGVLIAVTVVISVCADYLVDSIDDIVATGKVSKTFIGLILIPIVGNAAEHVTACVVAVKNNMDLAMGVAIGSSIQIALLVTPSLVILGWIIGQPMSLRFETFETVAFGLSVLVVTYTVQDGRSNYLEGAMLIGLYIIIALAFWASPSEALQKSISYFSS